MWFLSLVLFMWWVIFIDLQYVESALNPRDEANLIVMDKLFDVLLDLVSHILLRIFTLMFIMDIGLKF